MIVLHQPSITTWTFVDQIVTLHLHVHHLFVCIWIVALSSSLSSSSLWTDSPCFLYTNCKSDAQINDTSVLCMMNANNFYRCFFSFVSQLPDGEDVVVGQGNSHFQITNYYLIMWWLFNLLMCLKFVDYESLVFRLEKVWFWVPKMLLMNLRKASAIQFCWFLLGCRWHCL